MPPGIEDRAADCWEPLLAIADEAGADLPDRARAAAVYLTRHAKAEARTMGVELLPTAARRLATKTGSGPKTS